jgi:hypothetical protein
MTQSSRAKWGLACALLATSFVTSGCAATLVDPRVPAGAEKSEWVDFYLFGIVGQEEVDVRDLCPTARAREVHVGSNVATFGLSVVTLGIYTPRKVTVTCAKAGGDR